MLKNKTLILTCLVLLSILCLSAFFLNYWRLDRIPYGFHVDELSGSVDIGCLATEGMDVNNIHYPVFSDVHYGTPKPPTYIYPAIIWSKFFGYSAVSLRSLSVTVHIFGIIGLLLLANSFFGWRYAIITMTVASLSPWAWNLSRVGFESLFSATFMIWGLYFFFKPQKLPSIILAGFCFAAAMYSYPPFRVQIPLMVLSLVIYSHYKKPWSRRSWTFFAFSLIIPIIPLIEKTLRGETQGRFNTISIFSQGYLDSIHSPGHWMDMIVIFMNNFFMHLNGDFLFLRGDPSYIHSTRHFGILGWLDMAALVLALIWILKLLINKDHKDNPLILQKTFLLLLTANVLMGIVPAALTNSELPNSLRITGAWPFVCLFSGYFIWHACESWGVLLWISTVALSLLFAIVFFNVYFRVFPQEGKGMFAYWTLDEANALKTDEDWLKFVMLYRRQDYNARYYLMQYRQVGCSQSMKIWLGMNDYLTKHGNP